MNNGIISYFLEADKLRSDFIEMTNKIGKAESMKIWSRWIITHRSLCTQGNILLPDDMTYDSQLITELNDKGIDLDKAKYIHDWLVTRCQYINSIFKPIATVEDGGLHGNVSIKYDQIDRHVYLSIEKHNISQKIPLVVYRKMEDNYMGDKKLLNLYIFLCSITYNILDGNGLQWAVPPSVMCILRKKFACYTELFASPLNTFNNNYYSLFPLDKVFSSKGNFFTANNKNFIEGCYQINPPFIDQLFTKTSCRVLELLSIADTNNRDLTFIYIMPEWKDFITYNIISESRFCVKTISLRNGQHNYYQYSNNVYIPARFNSYIFILSTNVNICDNQLEAQIRDAFYYR